MKQYTDYTKDDLMRLLESLTPGGSEFYESPENCARFIRERKSKPPAAPDLLAVAKKLDALQRQFEFYSMGNKMPGNDLYSGLLMEIVTDARAAIAAAKGEK